MSQVQPFVLADRYVAQGSICDLGILPRTRHWRGRPKANPLESGQGW